MAKSDPKTKPGPQSVDAFVAALEGARQDEARRLVAIFSEVSGFDPVIWAGSMIGFGRYDYAYPSGTKGSSLATGFAPRAAEIVLYLNAGFDGAETLLAGLGKHRIGKSCLYLKRLDGIDDAVLRQLIRTGLEDLGKRWTILPA